MMIIISFLVGILVGGVINFGWLLKKRKNEIIEKIERIENLPTKWTSDGMHFEYDYKNVAISFANFVNQRSMALNGRNVIHNVGVSSDEMWYIFLKLFYMMSVGGVKLELYVINKHLDEYHEDCKNFDYDAFDPKEGSYNFFPRISQDTSDYELFEKLDKIALAKE